MSLIDEDNDELYLNTILDLPPLDSNDPFQNVTQIRFPLCNVTLAEDSFRPDPFQESARLKRTNQWAVRFGGSNDMMTLLQGSSEEKSAYLTGLVATSVVVAIIFFTLSILGCVFKFASYRRVGFLAGRFVRPRAPRPHELDLQEEQDGEDDDENKDSKQKGPTGSDPTDWESMNMEPTNSTWRDESLEEKKVDDTQEDPFVLDLSLAEASQEVDELKHQQDSKKYAEWMQRCENQKRRHFRARIAFVVSLVCVILCAILFCVYGNKYVSQSMTRVGDGIRHIIKLCNGAIVLVEKFIYHQEQISDDVRRDLENFNGICPRAFESLCESVDQVETCDFSQMPMEGIKQSFQNLMEIVSEPKNWLYAKLLNLKADLENLKSELEDMLDTEAPTEWAFWVSFAFSITILLVCVFMIVTTLTARSGRGGVVLNFLRKKVMFPVFVFLVLLSFIFCIIFTITTIAASDWCINSPDQKVSYVLDKIKGDSGSVVYDFAQFYVRSCPPDAGPSDVRDQSGIVLNVLNRVKELLEDIKNLDPQEFSEQCGRDSSFLLSLVGLIERQFCLLSSVLEHINRYFWCRHWTPIYVIFMHEAICYEAQEGMAWVASTMLCILIFSFVALLLRGSAFEIEDEDAYLESVRRLRTFCKNIMCCCCRFKRKRTFDNDDALASYIDEDSKSEGSTSLGKYFL